MCIRKKSLQLCVFAVVIVFALGVGFLGANGPTEAAAKQKPIKWIATSVYGSGLQFYKVAAYFAKKVKIMSNGRLIIQMNTGGSIVPPFSEQEAVSKGSLDMSFSTSMYIKGKFPAAVLFGASFGAFDQLEFLAWCETGGATISGKKCMIEKVTMLRSFLRMQYMVKRALDGFVSQSKHWRILRALSTVLLVNGEKS